MMDDLLRMTFGSITNNDYETDDPVWIHVTLPLKFGSLGIQSVIQLAP